MKIRSKKCRVCKTSFKPYRTTQVVCSAKCAAVEGKRKRERQAKRERQEFNRNDIRWVKNKLQQTINEITRIIDTDLPCLATGTWGQMQAGHVFSRGAHGQMRYNLHNIHRQSAYSNNKQSHDGLMQEMLAKEFGEDYLEYLKERRGDPVQKLSIAEYQAAYDRAREVRNQLKKEMEGARTPLSVAQRIRIRNRVNDRIGITKNGITT